MRKKIPIAMSGYHANQNTSANEGYGGLGLPAYITVQAVLPMNQSSRASPNASHAFRAIGSKAARARTRAAPIPRIAL